MSALTITEIDALIIKFVEDTLSIHIDVEEIRKFTEEEDECEPLHQPLIDMLNIYHIDRIGVDGVVEDIFQILFGGEDDINIASTNYSHKFSTYFEERGNITNGEHMICLINCITSYAKEHSTPCRIDFTEEFNYTTVLNAYAYVFADYYARTEINSDIRELIKKYVLFVQSEQKRLLDEMSKIFNANIQKQLNMIKCVV
jgi:hypothetical protein